jgi:hypothetical protein
MQHEEREETFSKCNARRKTPLLGTKAFLRDRQSDFCLAAF